MPHAFAPQQKFNTVDYNLEQEAKTNLDYLKSAKNENKKIVDENQKYADAEIHLADSKERLEEVKFLAEHGLDEIDGMDIETYIANFENAIAQEEKFLEGHDKDIEDFYNASKRLSEIKPLEIIAKYYYEAAKRMQEIKAEYAQKQFDYGLKMYGKESVEISADKERDVKLTELRRDYAERWTHAEDEAEKKRLKSDYDAAVTFIEKQADFKKKYALAEQNDFSRPIQKKAAEITVRWQQEIIDALEANGIGLDEVTFDENGEIQGRSGRAVLEWAKRRETLRSPPKSSAKRKLIRII